MLIFIVLIFLGFLSALGYSIYSFLYPFYESLYNIKDYNIAYYGAIGSVERAKLALRFRKAGFEGSGGWIGNSSFGPSSDWKIYNFGFLSKFKNGMWWEITSRVDSIPESGKGDIPTQLRYTGTDYGGPSSNFNMLEHVLPLQIALFKDKCLSVNAYKDGNCGFDKISNEIKIILRLPAKIYEKKLERLDVDTDIDGNGISDDIIINRTIFGSGDGKPFNIFPTIAIDYTNNSVELQDTAIRESIINQPTDNSNTDGNIIFGDSKQPIVGQSEPNYHNIIPQDHIFSGEIFTNIFSNGEDIYLKLSLVNFMQTSSNFIYPFLEYRIYGPSELSDRFFHIKGIGKVGKYKVQILIKQPAVKSSAASDFVIIF